MIYTILLYNKDIPFYSFITRYNIRIINEYYTLSAALSCKMISVILVNMKFDYISEFYYVLLIFVIKYPVKRNSNRLICQCEYTVIIVCIGYSVEN